MKYSALGISVLLFVGVLLVSCSQQQDPTKPAPIETSIALLNVDFIRFHAQYAPDLAS